MRYQRIFLIRVAPLLAGVVLLYWFGRYLWGLLSFEAKQAVVSTVFVAFIGVFLYGVFWAIRFLRAPDLERQGMEADVTGRLSRVRRTIERQIEEVRPFLDQTGKYPHSGPEEEFQGARAGRAKARRSRAPVTLSARESRGKKLIYLIGGLLVGGIFYGLMIKGQAEAGEISPQVIIFIVIIGAPMVWSAAALLVSLLYARPLVDIGPLGLAAPAMYKPTIAWHDIVNVELVLGKSPAPFLLIEFANPKGPASWRGLRGKCHGFFARSRGRATLRVPLRYADHDGDDVCAAIDHYLLDRGSAVVVRSRGITD